MRLPSVILFAVFLFASSESVSQESAAPTAGSDARREICNALAETYVGAYEDIKRGTTVEQLNKQLAIAYAGDEIAQNILPLLQVGTVIADFYVSNGRSPNELSTDFLFECVTSSATLDIVIQNWVSAVLPEGHELRTLTDSTTTIESGPVKLNDDGSLAPASYRSYLGDEFSGTQSALAYNRRKDGKLDSCGLEFSHSIYDYQYSFGQPVKVSGSINLGLHPISVVAGMVKIKAEKFVIFPQSAQNPVRLDAVPLANVYSLAESKPVTENAENFDCEDASYFCHVVFQWDKFGTAIVTNSIQLAYRPEGGRTDVVMQLDFGARDEIAAEYFKFPECVMVLLQAIEEEMEQ